MRDRGAEFAVQVDKNGGSIWQLAHGQIELCYPKGCRPDNGIGIRPPQKQDGWVSVHTDRRQGAVTLLFGIGQPPLGLATLLLNKDRSGELRTAGGPLWVDSMTNRPETATASFRDGIGRP